MSSNGVLYIAIDPGKAGGIAWARVTGPCADNHAVPMPDTHQDVYGALKTLVDEARRDRYLVEVGVEQAGQYFPSSNPKADAQKVGSLLKLREHYGRLWGHLDALKVPARKVVPRAWQAIVPGLGKGTSADAYAARKKRIKEFATERFPALKPTLKTADALCLLEYLKRGC